VVGNDVIGLFLGVKIGISQLLAIGWFGIIPKCICFCRLNSVVVAKFAVEGMI
jgi:hypothetical protein